MLNTQVLLLSGSNTTKAWRHEMIHSEPKDRYLWITRGQAKAILNGAQIGLTMNTLVYVPAHSSFALSLSAGSYCMMVQTEFLAKDAFAPARLRILDVGAQKDVANLIENIRMETDTAVLGFQRATKAHVLLLEVWVSRILARQPDAPD